MGIENNIQELSSKYSGKNVLVTGGLGFIGSNLVRTLCDAGATVLTIDSLLRGYGGNRFNLDGYQNKVQINISDVRDAHSMKCLVQGVDYIFNLAGQTSHVGSMEDPMTDLEINGKAQLFILEACRENNTDVKIVYASTRQIYGKPQYLPVDEKHPLNPVDVNGINKIAGEWYHTLYNNVYGIRATALRMTNTYGPRLRVKDARQTFVGIWMRLLLEGKAFEVWGGEQLRDFTYVDDVVSALLMAGLSDDANGKVYNIGGCERVNLKELAQLLIDCNGEGEYKICSYPNERKQIDIGDYYSDDSLIRSELGWEPKVSLSEGLKLTLEYYSQYLAQYIGEDL